MYFTASDDNVQLLFKMVISVNQLSLHGSVADLIFIKKKPLIKELQGNLLH